MMTYELKLECSWDETKEKNERSKPRFDGCGS